jgi:hypothetical protein
MAYYPNYPKLVREKGRKEVYEMTPQGYYRHIPTVQELYKNYGFRQPTEIASFPALYGGQAQKMYQPAYKSAVGTTENYYKTLQNQLQEKVRNEYQKRGILESGLYGKEMAESTSALGLQKASAIDQLKQALAEKVSGEMGNQLGYARTASSETLSNLYNMYQKLIEAS